MKSHESVEVTQGMLKSCEEIFEFPVFVDSKVRCTIHEDLRLVFTSDGVVVGVVIRSVDRCDLVKIKPTESEAEGCIRL